MKGDAGRPIPRKLVATLEFSIDMLLNIFTHNCHSISSYKSLVVVFVISCLVISTKITEICGALFKILKF